jgi:hypothetical protein
MRTILSYLTCTRPQLMFSHYLRLGLRRPLSSRAFTMGAAPTFKPFTLALIQLGQIGADKSGRVILILTRPGAD